MNEIKGKLVRKSFALNGNPELTFQISEGKPNALALEEKDYLITLGNPKKRSLDANAYFHLLVNRIAHNTKRSDSEVKKWLNLEYGTVMMIDSEKYIITMEFKNDLEVVYPYCKVIGVGEVNGKRFRHWQVYKQTHTLDTKEMANLIDGTIREANDLGIETLTPNELAKMKGYGK